MRKPFSDQGRFDVEGIGNVQLNLNCRDEIIPILSALQYIYSKPELRDSILKLVAKDINRDTRRDVGREGLDDWSILVLAAVRLGCNLTYDKLHDLAEQHRALRQLMGIGDWDSKTSFNWRRIRNTLCRLSPETIDEISHLIVAEGHTIEPQAAEKVRADSFVIETNIHHPTESGLIYDGVQKIIEFAVTIATVMGLPGWRQHEHLLKQIKSLHRAIAISSRSKKPGAKKKREKLYRQLLKRAGKITRRAERLVSEAKTLNADIMTVAQIASVEIYVERTKQVMNTAFRRVVLGESVPNSDKLFSIFETHTQLYRRGKVAQPNQFGRLVMVYEDASGFITHHYLLDRDQQDRDVVVEQTRIVQTRHGGEIKEASFDRGFYSEENETMLQEIIEHPCLPKTHPKAFAEQLKEASVRFRKARQRHSGIESAIGALQSGNGLKRCRDRSELGFRRYLSLAVLGRNLHVLGKLLIQQRMPDSKAAETRRAA